MNLADLKRHQNEQLIADIRILVDALDTNAFAKWLSDRMHQDACDFTKAAIRTATEKCGRCGTEVTADSIAVTGPYRTCPPCTQAIRN